MSHCRVEIAVVTDKDAHGRGSQSGDIPRPGEHDLHREAERRCRRRPRSSRAQRPHARLPPLSAARTAQAIVGRDTVELRPHRQFGGRTPQRLTEGRIEPLMDLTRSSRTMSAST